MRKYKDLIVPNIIKEHIDVYKVLGVRSNRCMLFGLSNIQQNGQCSNKPYKHINVCSNIDCKDCIMDMDNIVIGLEYLCDNNYITADERLKILLDYGV